MALFEAGAQGGEHKHPRGFLPTPTYSAYELHHPGFRRAIERHIAEEKELLAEAWRSMLDTTRISLTPASP